MREAQDGVPPDPGGVLGVVRVLGGGARGGDIRGASALPPIRRPSHDRLFGAASARLSELLVFKGGKALDFVWRPNRGTIVLDFSADVRAEGAAADVAVGDRSLRVSTPDGIVVEKLRPFRSRKGRSATGTGLKIFRT